MTQAFAIRASPEYFKHAMTSPESTITRSKTVVIEAIVQRLMQLVHEYESSLKAFSLDTLASTCDEGILGKWMTLMEQVNFIFSRMYEPSGTISYSTLCLGGIETDEFISLKRAIDMNNDFGRTHFILWFLHVLCLYLLFG